MRLITLAMAAAVWSVSSPAVAQDETQREETGEEASAEAEEAGEESAAPEDGASATSSEEVQAAADDEALPTTSLPEQEPPAEAAAVGETPPEMGHEVRPEGAPKAAEEGRFIEPFVAIAGGVRFESLALRPEQTRQPRHPTVAVSRFGAQGRVSDRIRFKSEFEFNIGGPLGYGASVWEGQAMMSVRDQYLQYDRGGWSFAAGRVTDRATVDFFSAHVADLLGTDAYVRDPLLFAGYDRGTGLFAKYEIMPGLRAGLSFHSTSPTGTTGTLLVGGELFPYDRPFYTAAAAVGRSEFMQPDQNLHIYFGTPSIEYEDEFLQFRSAAQAYTLDTDMSTDDDQRILGYNLRASGRVKLLGGKLVPFLNISRNENEMLAPQDQTVKLEDTYRAYTVTGGVDFNYLENNGVGIQFAQLAQQRGDASRTTSRYLNIGHTWWLEDSVSVGVRYAAFIFEETNRESTASMLGMSGAGGHQSLFLTSRLIY